jgi:large subunit ribosomal protein L10
LPRKLGKDFYLKKKEVNPLAFTKEQKKQMVDQYEQWLRDCQGTFLVSYEKMGMNDIDALRAKAREAGGEAHVVKNTLMEIALERVGYTHNTPLTGTTIAGFSFDDPAAFAKIVKEATKSDVFEIKFGFLDGQELTIDQVKALGDLPALPVMRATLLGTINAAASQLVRTLAEPGRGIAAVVKAYSEKEAAPAA